VEAVELGVYVCVWGGGVGAPNFFEDVFVREAKGC